MAVAVAEAPGEPDAAANGGALAPADGDTVTVSAGGSVGEAVVDAPPHPPARIAAAIAAQRGVRIVALERRFIDSP
jgi:hypothetical protein